MSAPNGTNAIKSQPWKQHWPPTQSDNDGPIESDEANLLPVGSFRFVLNIENSNGEGMDGAGAGSGREEEGKKPMEGGKDN
jgi:hypothetical protein